MTTIMKSFVLVGILKLCIHFCSGQGNAARPIFPSVFQVEVQGIFKDVKKEMDGSLYYDSANNRGAFHFTYEGETKRYIYRLDDNELLQIRGTDCVVSDIRTDTTKTFFPFLTNWNQDKYLAKPDDLLFFANSTFVREESNFPSYIYKGKLNSPLYDGSNCDVTHTFTKPEAKDPECVSNKCQPTLATISITCWNKDGSLKVDTNYDFFRFKSDVIDTNVFLPPPGTFCQVTNKNPFPGLPGYFSFSYDLTDEQKKTSRNSGGLTVHKKVWYDSKMNNLRMDEFDADGLLLASRVFDINGGVGYTSIASLSTCEMGIINSGIVPLEEMTKLPKVFFQGKYALSKAVYVGTRLVHGQDYEVWSLLSNDKRTSAKIVEEFYFTKSVPNPGIFENLKLSHAEIYTYPLNTGSIKKEAPVIAYLPVNNFIDRLRWEAFDVSSCFAKEQKREFRLKVDGPPTMKDSKMFQEVLNQLYTNLIRATNISALRLNELACVFDGVKIVEFTGRILDKPKVISPDVRKFELDMNEAYNMIQHLAKAGTLSLKLSKDGQVLEYKITEIGDNIQEEEDKNLYSGGVVAGVVFGGMILGMVLGPITCYQCKKCEKRRLQEIAEVQMTG